MSGRAIARDAAVAAVFSLAFAALFSPVLFGGRYLTDGGDGVRFALAAYLRAPTLWEPAVMLGYPWSSDLNGFWDPLAAALRVFPGTFNLYMFAAYPIAALGAYRLVFATTRSVLGGSIAGLSFAMGGFMIGHLCHYDLVHPAAWTPWIQWSLTSLRERASAQRIAAGAIVVALAAVSGGPQVLAYTLVAAVVLVPALAIRSPGARSYVLVASATIGLGIGLAGIALVPGAHLAALSVRAHIAFDRFISDSIPLGDLPVRLFFPYFLGMSQSAVYPYSSIATGSWVELSSYAGIIPFALAAIAVGTGFRDRLVGAWAIVLLLGLALSTGDGLKLAHLTYHLPLLDLFRAQGRYALIVTLAIAVLAGHGASAIERGTVRMRAAGAAIAFVGAIVALTLIAIHARAGDASVPRDPLHNPALGIPLAVFAAGAIAIIMLSARPTARTAHIVLIAAVYVDLCSFARFGTWRAAVVTDADLTAPPQIAALASDARRTNERIRFIATGAPWGFDPGGSLAWNLPLADGHVQLEVARTAALLHLDNDGDRSADAAADGDERGAALAAVRYIVLPAGSTGSGAMTTPESMPDMNVRIGSPAWVASDWVGRDSYTAAFAQPISTTRVELETSLNDAIAIDDGAHVADVILTTSDGERITLPLLAGRDTAERGYDEPAVRRAVRHARAPIARTVGDDHTYRAVRLLPHAERIVSLAITWRGSDTDRGYLNIHRVALDDDATGKTYPLTPLTALELASARWRRVDSTAPFLIFENRHPYGRAWRVNDVIPGTPLTVHAAVQSASFDPARAAIAEGAVALHTRADKSDTVRIDDLQATEMALDVSCAQPCYVVTSDAYDAGWSAAIDGDATRVYPTDEALRGVFVPAGRHRVTFVYRPDGLALGVAVSVMSAFALAALGLASARRRSLNVPRLEPLRSD